MLIPSFVRAMMKYYYPSDEDVRKDIELQEWIKEIFIHGAIGNNDSGLYPRLFDKHAPAASNANCNERQFSGVLSQLCCMDTEIQ